MKEMLKWAFIIEKDEFVRLSLNKILKKYGFEVEEVEHLSQLEGRKKEIEGGMILADVDIDDLEQWSPFLRKWNDRFILMTPLITDELTTRLKRFGVRHILKKPVEPKLLKRVLQKFSFPEEERNSITGKKREGSRSRQKGGEEG